MAAIFCASITTPITKSSRLPAFACALIISAITAHPFVAHFDTLGNARRWRLDGPSSDVPANSVNRATRAIRYYLPLETANAGFEEPERNSLRVAFAQWQAVLDAQIRFEEAGVIPNGDINVNDGTNLVFFAKSELVNGGRDSILNRGVAITFFKTVADNELAEADIVFNNFQSKWFSEYFDKANTNFFIEGTALHEIGHWLGLDHSPAGAATMFARTLRGVTAQTGLSVDELFAARSLYPASATVGALGGSVRIDGSPAFGAVISVEDQFGRLLQSTVTRADGSYVFPSLPSGNYQVFLSPLDSPSGSSLNRLVTGADIAASFSSANTTFLPGTNFPAAVSPSVTNKLDLATTALAPAFRITRILPPNPPGFFTAQNSAAQIAQGTSGMVIGVGGPNLPTSGATLEVTGPGITLGSAQYQADAFDTTPPLNIIYCTIQVSASAAPGLRTLIVRRGTDIAYANGFLEVVALAPDDNYDGLDDIFQRHNFSVFTSSEAAPGADPDRDTVSNQREYVAGTNPTSPTSFLAIDQITYSASGAIVRWLSVVGKRYQMWARDVIEGAQWQAIGSIVTATSAASEQSDPTARSERYYRLEVIP